MYRLLIELRRGTLSKNSGCLKFADFEFSTGDEEGETHRATFLVLSTYSFQHIIILMSKNEITFKQSLKLVRT